MSDIPLTRLSELQAINLLLQAAGEEQVATLEDTGLSDVAAAVERLHDTSRAFQAPGWSFNTDKNYSVTRESNGHLIVPSNALHIDIARNQGRNGVQRGDKLWDTDNHTFVWDRDLQIDVVWFLSFEELPDTARTSIAVRSARMYQREQQGSTSIERFTADDEAKAGRMFKRAENRRADHNIFHAGDMASLQNRTSSYTFIPDR